MLKFPCISYRARSSIWHCRNGGGGGGGGGWRVTIAILANNLFPSWGCESLPQKLAQYSQSGWASTLKAQRKRSGELCTFNTLHSLVTVSKTKLLVLLTWHYMGKDFLAILGGQAYFFSQLTYCESGELFALKLTYAATLGKQVQCSKVTLINLLPMQFLSLLSCHKHQYKWHFQDIVEVTIWMLCVPCIVSLRLGLS